MRKIAIAAVAVPAALLLGLGIATSIHVHSALRTAGRQVAKDSEFSFTLRTLARAPGTQTEVLPAPGAYNLGLVFRGATYLAGPGGLAEINPETPTQTVGEAAPHLWLPGTDLPPSPIVALASGKLRGFAQPLLLMAARGEGVLLWDGETMRQIRPADERARDVTALLPLSSGDLLLGTHALGVLLFDGRRLTQFHPGLAAVPVTALAGTDGDIWVGTRNRGVFHWRAGEVETFSTESGLPDPQIESLVQYGVKTYAGTPLGIEEFDGSRPARTLAKGLFAHALAIQGTTLLIAGIDQGIHEIDLGSHGESLAVPARVGFAPGSMATQSFFSGDRSATMAITPYGIFRRSGPGDWRAVMQASAAVLPAPVLADRNISALQFAPDGRLWIGYFDHGLDVLSADGRHAQHTEDDHVFCVNRILADPKRNTFDVATANGLVIFDDSGRERQALLRADGLIADQVNDVAFTADGMAVATPAGITFSDSRGMQSLYAFHGLVNNHVYALATDTDSAEAASASPSASPSASMRPATLMAGTLGGISMLRQDAVWRNINMANSALKQNWITAIVPLDDGWLAGTYGAGVTQIDRDGQVTAMDQPAPAAIVNPHAMLVNADYVFAGSLNAGLLVYSRAARRWRKVTAGLPSLNVTAFAERDGLLYIGTDNGLVKMREAELPQ